MLRSAVKCCPCTTYMMASTCSHRTLTRSQPFNDSHMLHITKHFLGNLQIAIAMVMWYLYNYISQMNFTDPAKKIFLFFLGDTQNIQTTNILPFSAKKVGWNNTALPGQSWHPGTTEKRLKDETTTNFGQRRIKTTQRLAVQSSATAFRWQSHATYN